MMVHIRLILIPFLMCIFSCTKKGLSIDNGSGGNSQIAGVTLSEPEIVSGTTRFKVTYTNTQTVNLATSGITLTSADGVACDISVEAGATVTPVIVLSNCTGTGEYTLTIASGTGISSTGDFSAELTSSTYTFDSTRPTITIAVGTKVGTDYRFALTYTGAAIVNLLSSHISVTKTLNTTCDAHSIENGQTATPTIVVPGCMGSGTLSISISFGSATNVYGLTDSGALGAAVTIYTMPGELNSNFVLAFSTRRVNPNYTGSLIKVRNGNTNATMDIGYNTTNNELDISALTTFLAGAEGFIDTWYDQSGNGFNATQANNALQPKIQVNTNNSKYGLLFSPTVASANGLVLAKTASQIGTDIGQNFELASGAKSVFSAYQAVQLSERFIFSNKSGGNKHFSISQSRPLHMNTDPLDSFGEIRSGGLPAFTTSIAKISAVYDPTTTRISCKINGGASAVPAGINCTEITDNNVGSNFESAAAFAIGRDGAASTDQTKHFSGHIHELLIYNEAVSRYDEIAAELWYWNSGN